MKRASSDYSVVIPVYNEEESLPFLFEELCSVWERLGKPFELIFVNDCSNDRSPEVLDNFQKQRPDIVEVLHLPRRSGQTRAMKMGLDQAKGEVVITMDADLQNDPADIPLLLAKLQGNYDVICGWRRERADKRLKAWLSKGGNALQRLLSGSKIHDMSCTLRAYRRDCLKDIPLNWEGQHRFIPLSLILQGYRIGEILSHHRPRQFGKSKYRNRRVFKVAVDLVRVMMVRGQR